MRSHPLFMTVWLATGALIGLLPVAIGTYFVMQQAYKIAVYPPTPTIILDWGNRRHEGFRLKARYEYMVGNKRHISTQAFSTPRWGDDDTWGDIGAANEVEAWDRFVPGQEAIAFYNPAAPGDAFLLRDDLYGYCGFLYFGWPVLTFVVAVRMSVAPEARRRKAVLVMAILWHGIGAAAVLAYLTVSDWSYFGTFVTETVAYELVGLIPLRYGLAAIRTLRERLPPECASAPEIPA